MTRSEFLDRWTKRRDDLQLLGAQVSGAALIDQILADVRALEASDEGRIVSLVEASRIGGYSADTLGRMIRKGQLHNAGRKNAPKLRAGDVPVKPGFVAPETLPPYARRDNVTPIHRRIARQVASER